MPRSEVETQQSVPAYLNATTGDVGDNFVNRVAGALAASTEAIEPVADGGRHIFVDSYLEESRRIQTGGVGIG